MKLPNGYGSIVKMKGNLRRPYRVYAPYDSVTKKRPTIGYTKTKKEAMALLAEYHKNKNLFVNKPTLEDIFNLFIPTKRNKSKDTIAMYYTSWNYFEDIKDEYIVDIKSHHIQDIVDFLIDDEKSYSTVHKVKTLANQLYKTAMKDDFASKNYAQFVILPKKPKPDNRIFSDDEIDLLVKLSKTDYWAKIIVCMLFTLMRPSEFLNITKFNVHLKQDYLIGGSKTDAGIDRYIPIYTKIKHIMKWLYDNSTTEYLVQYNNKKINYRYFLDKYYETLEKAGVQKLNPHKLRKTGATYFTARGIDRSVLQKIMGHVDYKTTDQYYIGEMHKELQIAMKNI